MHHDENYKRLFAPPLMVDHLPRAGAAGAGLDEVGFSTPEKLRQFTLTLARWRHRVVQIAGVQKQIALQTRWILCALDVAAVCK